MKKLNFPAIVLLMISLAFVQCKKEPDLIPVTPPIEEPDLTPATPAEEPDLIPVVPTEGNTISFKGTDYSLKDTCSGYSDFIIGSYGDGFTVEMIFSEKPGVDQIITLPSSDAHLSIWEYPSSQWKATSGSVNVVVIDGNVSIDFEDVDFTLEGSNTTEKASGKAKCH
jgi:hypothetical protein